MMKPLQTNRNYWILILPKTKGIFTIFDRFDRNYGSVFVFVQPKFFGSFLFQNRCSTDVKKDAGPSKLK